jgi:hypothetical protein
MSEYIGRDFADKRVDNSQLHRDRAVARGKWARRRGLAMLVAVPAVLYGLGSSIVRDMNEKKAIETAPLIETTHYPSRCYNGEKMMHTISNYHAYLDRVVEKKGHYLVPDVDRNGKCVVK